jgi:catechol 2,3-dioxygenase-like lactoylglutathione lyase family enzyme
MGESLGSVGAITLFVEELARSKAFYSRVFEVDAVFEDENSVAFRFDNLVVNLLRRGAAVNELLGPVPEARPGAVCADLRQRGVSIASGPVDRPWGLRTAAFFDPDGYLWEVAAKIGEA